MAGLVAVGSLAVLAGVCSAQRVNPEARAVSEGSADCNQPAPEALTEIKVPGNPFQALPTSNGCWIFVSMPGVDADSSSGLAVLERSGGVITLARVVSIPGQATGMVLTHDGKVLIVASNSRIGFLDVERLISGVGDPALGSWSDPTPRAAQVYVNVTADDGYLFISNEDIRSITVFDLKEARRVGFAPTAGAMVGRIPVGQAPIALTFSPGDRYLYTTSQTMPDLGWPIECKPESATNRDVPPRYPQGAIVVVDVERAKQDPEHSVIARVPAGCNPVRLVTSPDGAIAYVSVRGDHMVRAFDAGKLISDPSRAEIGRIPVGPAPVGLAVIDGGGKVIVTGSNRFGGGADDRQALTVIDTRKLTLGAGAVIGRVVGGAFPREIRVTADQRTLAFTNFRSRTIAIVDLARLPLVP